MGPYEAVAVAFWSALARHLPAERELIHERLKIFPQVDLIDDCLDAGACMPSGLVS